MYYVYDLLKDKTIFKSENLEELLVALNMKYDQNGFRFEKIYKNKYVITKKKPTKKRLTQLEKIKIIVSDFSLRKIDFKGITDDELELLEKKIEDFKISKIFFLLYLEETYINENRKKRIFEKKLTEILTNKTKTNEDLKNAKLKDLEQIDAFLEKAELDTVVWYHYFEGIS